MKRLTLLVLVTALLVSITASFAGAAQGPLLGTWSEVTTSGTYTPRIKAASAFANNRLYVFGGTDATGAVVGNAEALAMLTKAWETKTVMPTPRAGASAVAVGSKIYVVGGYGADGSPSGVVEMYDTSTNKWTTMASMPTPRSSVVALLYVAGTANQIHVYGSDPAGAYPASVAYEIYDVATNTWTQSTHSAPSGQCEACGAVAKDIKTGTSLLYLFGGYNGGAAPAPSAWRTDPAAGGIWQEIHESPNAVIQASTVVIDAAGSTGGTAQYPLIIGGNTDRANTYSSSCMVYESGDFNGWIMGSDVAPDLPEPRGDKPALCIAGGYVYIAGGSTTGGPATKVYRAQINAANYPPAPPVENPLLVGWTDTGADILTPRWYTANAVVNNKLYVIGGWNSANSAVNNNEEYDPATNTWTLKAPMPVPVRGAVAAAINGKIYVAGGSNSNQNVKPVDYQSTLQIYDPATDEWSTGAPMPTPRNLVTGFAADGKLHVLGGVKADPNNSSNEINAGEHEVYDPATGSWSTASVGCPWAMADASSTVVQSGDLVWAYFGGGYNWNTQLSLAARWNTVAGGAFNDQWGQIASFPVGGNSGCTIATVTDDSETQWPMVFGGAYGPLVGGYYDKIFAYHDPDDVGAPNQWVRDTAMPYGRGGRMAVAQIGDYVYIAAGMGPMGLAAATWRSAIGSGMPESVTSVGAALTVANGKKVNIVEPKIVTRTCSLASGGIAFWIEEDNRSSALRVGPTTDFINVGNKVLVNGMMAVDKDTGMRTLAPDNITIDTNVYPIPAPIGITNKSFGGGTTATQPGRPGASGINNVGMLVKVCGKITSMYAFNPSEDELHYFFYIDDGSNLSDGTSYFDIEPNVGLRVSYWGYNSFIEHGDMVNVTGIVTLEKINGVVVPVMLSDEITMGDVLAIKTIAQ